MEQPIVYRVVTSAPRSNGPIDAWQHEGNTIVSESESQWVKWWLYRDTMYLKSLKIETNLWAVKAQPDPDPGHWAGLYDEGVSTIEVGPREVTGLDVADG